MKQQEQHSDETRKKMSDAKIGLQAGENNPFFGKYHSDETKQKMSEVRKGILLGRRKQDQ